MLDYLGGPDVVTRVLERGSQEDQSEKREDVKTEAEAREERGRGMLLTTGAGTQTAWGYWKRQENRFSPRASRRKTTLPIHQL